MERRRDFSPVSDPVLKEWVCNRSDEELRDELAAPHPDVLGLAVVLRERIKSINAFLQGCEKDKRVQQSDFQRLMEQGRAEVPAAKKLAERRKRIREFLVSQLTPSRADLFVIPGIPGQKDHLGFIAPFRRVLTIARSDIGQSLSDARASSTKHVVVASCRPALTHALVQKFVLFFSRVGITTYFESDQRTLVQLVADEVAS